MNELATLDAVAQAELVRRGEATPTELVDAAIARIEKLDPELHAVILPRFEKARAEAAGDLPDGPFRGVPFLMKDLGAGIAGEPYHAGMNFLKRHAWTESEDAYFTAKLRRAGFVLLGRTNTPELGLLPTTEPVSYGPTRNPWNTAHSPGGSSGGAGAAVASGMVPAAHASDGGGSIRIPAAHCGLVGLKPTRGRNSFGPGLGERWSGFSAELVVTRSVRDTAAILDVVSGPMPGDPYSAAPPARPFLEEVGAEPGRLRIGLMTSGPRGLPIDPACSAAAESAGRMLEALGHHVELSHPAAYDEEDAGRDVATVIFVGIARALAHWGEKVGQTIGPDDVEPLTWAVAEVGRGVSAAEYMGQIDRIHGRSRRMAAWWESGDSGRGFDLLVTPTTGAPPPELGSFVGPDDQPLAGFAAAVPFGLFTSSFNATGQPAISLPLHWTDGGLPCGAHFVAPTGGEDRLLRIAAQLEASNPWRDRRPPLHA